MISRRARTKNQVNRGKRRRDIYNMAKKQADSESLEPVVNNDIDDVIDISSKDILDPLIEGNKLKSLNDLTNLKFGTKEAAEDVVSILKTIASKVKERLDAELISAEWLNRPFDKKLSDMSKAADVIMKLNMVLESGKAKEDKPSSVRHDHYLHQDMSIEEMEKRHDELSLILGKPVAGVQRRKVKLLEDDLEENPQNMEEKESET